MLANSFGCCGIQLFGLNVFSVGSPPAAMWVVYEAEAEVEEESPNGSPDRL